MSVSIEPSKILCEDVFKVGSQKGKAMERRALASKLTNLNRQFECQFA